MHIYLDLIDLSIYFFLFAIINEIFFIFVLLVVYKNSMGFCNLFTLGICWIS